MSSEKKLLDLQKAKDTLLWEAYQFAKNMETVIANGLVAETVAKQAQKLIDNFSSANRMYILYAERLLQGEKDAI